VVLERQRLVDGQVVGYEIRYFPRWIGDALTAEEIRTQSLVTAMRRVIGRVHSRLRLRIIASVARPREAKYLGTKVGPRCSSARIRGWLIPRGRSSTESPSIGETATRWTSNSRRGRKARRDHKRCEETVVRYRTGVLYGLSLLGGLIAWELIAAQFSKVVLSPPTTVARHLYAHTANLELPRLLWASLGHTALGYLLAVAVAVPLGFLMGRSERAFAMFDPIVNALYSIPTIAFVPFLVIWFGLFFPARTALVFIMCVFDILVTVSAGPATWSAT